MANRTSSSTLSKVTTSLTTATVAVSDSLRKCCSGTLLRVIDNLERQFDTQLEPEEEIDQDILDIRDSIHYLKLRKKARGHYDELYNLESVLSSLSMEDRHSDGDRDDAQTPEADQTTTIKQDLQRIRDEVKAVALEIPEAFRSHAIRKSLETADSLLNSGEQANHDTQEQPPTAAATSSTSSSGQPSTYETRLSIDQFIDNVIERTLNRAPSGSSLSEMQRRMAKFRHSDSSNINGNGNGKLLPRERSVSGLVRVRSQPSRIGVEDGAWLGTVSPSVRSPVKLPSRFSTESQPYALGVQINGHETVGKGINAHTMYKITLTRYDRSVLKVKRRYNDFVLLRDMLFTRYREFRKRILPLPEKRVIGNFDSKFLSERERGLEAFLESLVLHPVLGNSKYVRQWFGDPRAATR